MTATGGAIINGTQNVIIYCVCIRNNVALGGTSWFLNGTRLMGNDPDAGLPYLRNTVPSQLIIPSFVSSVTGTYGCGRGTTFSDTSGDTINLALVGMLYL